MKKLNSILWGVVLIIIGMLWSLNALEITNINYFFDGWWTLFIIVPSFIGLLTEKNKQVSLVGLLIGAFLLASCQNLIDFEIVKKLAVPAIIVIIGISLVFGGLFTKTKKSATFPVKKAQNVNARNVAAIFSGQNVKFTEDTYFDGIELNAVFGGIKCDVKDSAIHQDCVINVCAIFGGVDIFLPDNVNIECHSTSLFGGLSNHKGERKIPDAPTVYINATCLFGGADVK